MCLRLPFAAAPTRSSQINVKHFPPYALKPYGLQLMTADEFLVNQFHLDADVVMEKLEAQTRKTRTPLSALLGRLARSVPRFSELIPQHAAVRTHNCSSEAGTPPFARLWGARNE
jgi:hypothetical protein